MKLPTYVYKKINRVKLTNNYRMSDGRYLPRGFESDLGSIPKYFWWFLMPQDVKYSAIIHDYEWLEGDFGEYNYHQANKNFYKNALIMDKIPRWKVIISYSILEFIMGIKILTRNIRWFGMHLTYWHRCARIKLSQTMKLCRLRKKF